VDGSPLTPEQQQDLAEAQERASSFAGAAKVAAFNGWTFAFFAAVSILSGLFSLPAFLVGVGLGLVAWNELQGRRRVLDHDPGGFELLWKNQLALMAIIVVYCAWAMYRSRVAPDPSIQELDEVLGAGTSELFQSIVTTMYGAVIAGTVVYQGFMARYYHARIARMKEYLEATPGWVVELQRSLRER
jgi:hypothetical protein